MMTLRLPSLVLIALTLSGCGPSTVDDEDSAGFSRQAGRLRAITAADQQVPSAEPSQTTTEGVVVEVKPHALKVETAANTDGVILATTADADIWENGKLISLTDLRPGDRVELFRERRGSRADGWQSLVVRVNVVSRGGNEDVDEGQYTTKIRGVVVEADTNAVTIRDADQPSNPPTVLPVTRLVKVQKSGTVGGISLLQPGDEVTLLATSRGNRQDGYIDVVTEITVEEAPAE